MSNLPSKFVFRMKFLLSSHLMLMDHKIPTRQLSQFKIICDYTLIDVDECTETNENGQALHLCGANAVCSNAIPGYTCECDPGFVLNVDQLSCRPAGETIFLLLSDNPYFDQIVPPVCMN